MNMIKSFLDLCLDFLFPLEPYCIICNTKISSDRKRVCLNCEKKIVKITAPVCIRCGRKLNRYINKGKEICSDCLKEKLYFEEARAFGSYEGILKKLIYEFKYKGKKELALFLGAKMFDVFQSLSWSFIDFIVPVPLHKRRERERGYNQALLLAKVLKRKTGIPISKALIRIKDTEHQTVLSKTYRQKNLDDAFKVKSKKFYKKIILLVDDVYTTGSTVNSCAKSLKQAGASKIYVLTCARGKNY